MAKNIQEYTVDEAWEEIEKNLQADPKPIEGLNVVYQYDITGEEEGTYQLHLSDGKAKVEKGTPAEPDCTLQMGASDFKDLLVGNLNGTAAFMSGKLKVKGDIGLAIKLESLLRKYDTSQYK
ncbi:SCP-2 sterol transfer family protein [Melghirimyces thermohalophilus]|uniref:SCP-2 sterol transfer family protein n=1 Tax=Melghirimyces thermohalophilus TaxID=1236220 RepID=A0A1G6MWH9_9BACL|nr:SCP2 sterol-binding domain-containing protein [Melghirimyces thermohalophilus]SDC59614.1 SCP-2 sterol transfer family protein [Melghirimyces thermohalophilus]